MRGCYCSNGHRVRCLLAAVMYAVRSRPVPSKFWVNELFNLRLGLLLDDGVDKLQLVCHDYVYSRIWVVQL